MFTLGQWSNNILGLEDKTPYIFRNTTVFASTERINYSMPELIPTIKVIGIVWGMLAALGEILFRGLQEKVIVLKVGRLSVKFNEPKSPKRKPNVRSKRLR
jgi:hypothetical protein